MPSGDDAIGRLHTADGKRPRVAIVGGTASIGMVATVLVEQFGCTPIHTPRGESVLALLRTDKPVDLVMIDLSVPDMDGIVAVQLIPPGLVGAGFLATSETARAASIGELPSEKERCTVLIDRAPCANT